MFWCYIIHGFAHKQMIPFSCEMLLSFIRESHKVISKRGHQINEVENKKGKISLRIFSSSLFLMERL